MDLCSPARPSGEAGGAVLRDCALHVALSLSPHRLLAGLSRRDAGGSGGRGASGAGDLHDSNHGDGGRHHRDRQQTVNLPELERLAVLLPRLVSEMPANSSEHGAPGSWFHFARINTVAKLSLTINMYKSDLSGLCPAMNPRNTVVKWIGHEPCVVRY